MSTAALPSSLVMDVGASARCPVHADAQLPPLHLPPQPADGREGAANFPVRSTLVLTGASRGIGHATVKLFAQAGWRIITCSRQSFERDRCPWEAGPEDHVKVDLGDRAAAERAVADIKARLAGGSLHALVNNAGISPKASDGWRLGSLTTPLDTWMSVFHVIFSPRQIGYALKKHDIEIKRL
jgi:hypothetical protein